MRFSCGEGCYSLYVYRALHYGCSLVLLQRYHEANLFTIPKNDGFLANFLPIFFEPNKRMVERDLNGGNFKEVVNRKEILGFGVSPFVLLFDKQL